MEDLNQKADTIIKEIAAKLEELRIKWIINIYNRTRNEGESLFNRPNV